MRFPHRARPVALSLIVVAAIVVGTPVAHSYKIAPLKNVHETMTLMASDCLQRAPLEMRPSICLQSPAAVMNNAAFNDTSLDLSSIGLGVTSRKELEKAVKWPDDPTIELAGLTIIRFGLTMYRECRTRNGQLKESLLCRSHYGDLQFLHAMASSPEEPTTETQRKMLAWAEFLYDVAVGEDLQQNFCQYWDSQRALEGKAEIAQVLAPTAGFPCTKSGPPWTVATLFSLRCKNPILDRVTCTESFNLRRARLNALGALLHMVQDSFAQGHASRGSCAINEETKQVTSKIECLPINQFYSYSAQDAKKHAAADEPPQVGRSCTTISTAIDEPILASANVLWLIQQKKGKQALTDYLKQRVFLLGDGHQPQAGPGECFKPN